MSSLLTNTAAMTALATLTSINKDMESTQNRISTGQRVATASDNAAYWSIATTMRSDNAALSTVQDALGLGSATVGTMYAALNSAVSAITAIKKDLVAATQDGVDRNKIQDDITAQQKILQGIGTGAVFNGENWMSIDSSVATFNGTKSTVSGFGRGATGALTVNNVTLDITKIALFDDVGNANVASTVAGTVNATGTTSAAGSASASAKGLLDIADATTGVSVVSLNISNITSVSADKTALTNMIAFVDKQLSAVTKAASVVGSIKTQLDGSKAFAQTLTDAINTGIGQLVDANMDQESTKLKALQVQQQLGVQALSIANSNSQNILSLFRS